MVNAKVLCHLTILLLSLCFTVVKCSLEPADQFIDNPTGTRQDELTFHKRPSFFVGSRYGRSGSSTSGSSVFATSKTRRLSVVPRNDRFFLSSRYGKRAEISTGTQLSSKPIPDQMQQEQKQKQQLLQFNDDFNANRMPPQQTSSSSLLSTSLPPYAYMSCVYTGLQSYYRCHSISLDASEDAFFKNYHDADDDDDDTDDDNVDNDENDNN